MKRNRKLPIGVIEPTSSSNTIEKEITMNTQNPTTVASTTLEMLGRKVTFIGGTSLWKVNITGSNGKTVNFAGVDLCKGVLNALSHLHTGSYCYNEVGLHLKKGLEELMMIGAADEVGYVRYHYAEAGNLQIDGIERLKNGDLLGSVAYRDGRLRVARIVRNVEYTENESDSIKHDRNAFNLFVGLDLLSGGYHVVLTPHFKNTTNQVTGEITTGATHVNMLLMHHLSVLDSTPQEARTKVFNAVAKNTTRAAMGREFRKSAKAVEENRVYDPGVTTVGVITDLDSMTITQTPVEELAGLMGYLYKGRLPVTPLRDLSMKEVLATIKARNLLVLIEA